MRPVRPAPIMAMLRGSLGSGTACVEVESAIIVGIGLKQGNAILNADFGEIRKIRDRIYVTLGIIGGNSLTRGESSCQLWVKRRVKLTQTISNEPHYPNWLIIQLSH